MLLDDTTDSNETLYNGKQGIDRSITYLVSGVIVLLFFMLTLLGMGQVQDLSEKSTGTPRAEAPARSADLNDPSFPAPAGTE